MSKNFLLRNFFKTGSSLVASVSIAISVLSPIVLNSSKTLADSNTLGISVEVNVALQNLANKNINPSQIAFAPNGGWVIIYNNYGYVSNNLRQDIRDKLYDLNKQKLSIDYIAFTPTGEWVIIYGYLSNGIAKSQNLPQEAVTTLSDISTKNLPINAVAFSPDGSFVFVYNRNSYAVSKKISPQVIDDLSYVKRMNEQVDSIAFSPDGNFIVIYGGDAYYPSHGIPLSLTTKIEEIIQDSVKHPSTAFKSITSVGFTSDNGWALLSHKVP